MRKFSKKPGISYRHIGRYGEIISVLFKYGFDDLLSTLKVERYTRIGSRLISRRRKRVARELSRWQRVTLAMEDLGPTFIKLGQFMSNRPDVVPAGLLVELERFQDKVAPFESRRSVEIIEKDLGRRMETVFASFEHDPFASASIAQVHRAILRTGEEVAVKIKRPRIDETFNIDIEIMYYIAHLLHRHLEEARGLDLMRVVGEFERAVRKEIDFQMEATQMERFANNFKNDPRLHVPYIYRSYSSRRVLTIEFIKGMKVSNVDELEKAGLDSRRIASEGADIVLKQIFDHGFYHADPHPGNIIIRPDGVICFIDFGMMGVVSPSLREHLGLIMFGIVNDDPKRIVKTLLQLSRGPAEDAELLEYEITELIEEYSFLSLKDYNIGDMLRRLLNIIRSHQLVMIPGVYLLIKALITIEGVGRRLDPDFNMINHVEPFARRMMKERFSPRSLGFDFYMALMDISSLVKDLPTDMRDIIRTVKSGKMHIEFEHKGLEPMLTKLDQLTTRLVFAIVLVALVVGSSLVILSNVPPIVNGIPLIGIIGFVGAGLIGFWLLYVILRHGKM
ncbi:MAG: ABC1 kinase family protein [Chitinispirillaceae bacterium]